MKHIFIVNPHAGAQSCEDVVRQSLKPYDGRVDYEIYVKQYRGDSREVVLKYRQRYPGEELRFYACGGDGTLREVALAVYGVQGVTFTSFAHGSGNDYVKYYGGPEEFRDVDRLFHGEVKEIDLMQVDNDSYALNATHFGFDFRVARTMDKLRRMPLLGKRFCYPTAVAWNFLTGMRNRCTVWADGEQLNDGRLLLCTAANGTHVGGSYCCAPRSRNDDGLIELCLVKPASRFKFLRLMNDYQRGTHLDNPRFARYIEYRRVHSLVIDGPQGFGVSLDGELYYASHIEVKNMARVLRFVVPAGAKAHWEMKKMKNEK